MNRALRVLIVEDSADDAQLLLCELRAGGFDATSERVETAEAMRVALDREAWDIVISDYQMPRFSGLAALKLLRARGGDLPFILVSGNVGEELAVEAMQAGANDYVMKDKRARLVPAVERELRAAAGRRERRRVEADFIASEARYRRLFESARDGILILNADTGAVVDVNPFLIERLRMPREHLVGKKFWEVASFRAIAADAAEFAELRARSYVRFDNESLIAADGRRIDVEFVCTVYPVDHHTVMQCSIRDITERKTAEANLHVQSAALEAAANSVVITDAEGRIEWANPAFTTLTGYTLAEAAGHNPRDLIKSGRHDQNFYRRMWETILAGRVWQGVLVNRRKDGSFYTEEMTITPVRDAAGQLAHFIAIKQDITARQQAEEKLQASERKFHALTDHSLDIVSVMDGSGIVRYESPSVERVLGWKPEEDVGRNAFERMHPDDVERVKTILALRVPVAGALETVEFRFRHKDGSWCVLEAIASNLLHEPAVAGIVVNSRDITDRRRAEEAQKSQLKFLETLVDTIPSPVFYKDADGIYLGCNRIWADQVMGLPKERIVGRTAFQLSEAIPPDLAKTYDEKDRWLLAHPGVQFYETDVLCADRVRRTFLFTKATFASTDKPVAGIVGVMLDITARKQAEELLQRSEERFRNLAENTSDWIWEVNEQGVYTYASPRVRDLLGYEPAEVLGRTPFEFMSPDEAVRVQPSFAALVAQRQPLVALENVNRHKDGHRVVLETSAVPIYDSVGVSRGYRGIDRDVTERKATERRLREQNEIISNSHEGVMIVNLDNTVSFWNRGAEAMFGWTAAEALGREADQLFGVDGLGVGATARAAVEREGFWNGEMRAQTRDGRRLILDCRMSLVRDDAGRPRARLSFLSDITEKKLLEEKFLHAQRLESIGMLAAGIAHDLNNVLAPIVFAGPLLRESLSAERDLKILHSLEQSAGRGAGLVKQILSFAHSTTGELRPTQVKHLARDIASLIEETFPKSIRLDQQIPANLWVVQGNPTQIHQVLLNLCVNARDAMPQGGTLRLVAENRRLDEAEARTLPEGRPGAWLVIEIADTGTGIAPDVLAHIWEPFFTTKGAGKGTGLGLSTVRGIVASHHGFVTLDTQIGRGTTFRVFLPATEEKPASGGTAPVFAAPAGHDELILVVDDDTAILETIATILTQHHYRVLAASDGVEAVSHFTAHPTEIALVITDVDMPLLGGTALARVLSQLRSGLPLLVMSGLPDDETGGSRSQVAEAKKLSPAFIRKPFTPEALLRAVHALLHPAIKA